MTEEKKGLEGIAKIIFDEVMEEIEEEFEESLGNLIEKEKLNEIIENIQEFVTFDVTKVIEEHYSDNISEIKKMILGEKLSRIISKKVKIELRLLVSEIIQNTMDLIDELRIEIIGEVFEETDDEEEEGEEQHAAA